VAGEGVLAEVSDDLLARAQAKLRITILNRYLRPPEVTHLFSHGDLLVMPYRKQCKSPLTDLATAFGVPVLRSDRVQGAGFRDGEHGLTYPHDRPELLASLLQGLALDPEAMAALRGRLKQRLPVRVAIRHLAERHRRMYRELLTARASMGVEIKLACISHHPSTADTADADSLAVTGRTPSSRGLTSCRLRLRRLPLRAPHHNGNSTPSRRTVVRIAGETSIDPYTIKPIRHSVTGTVVVPGKKNRIVDWRRSGY
jgi:hypothetical protein